MIRVQKRIENLTEKELLRFERWLDSQGQKVFSVKQAADFLDVCHVTIRKALKTKKLKGFQLNSMGTWRIPIEGLERFMEGAR